MPVTRYEKEPPVTSVIMLMGVYVQKTTDNVILSENTNLLNLMGVAMVNLASSTNDSQCFEEHIYLEAGAKYRY